LYALANHMMALLVIKALFFPHLQVLVLIEAGKM